MDVLERMRLKITAMDDQSREALKTLAAPMLELSAKLVEEELPDLYDEKNLWLIRVAVAWAAKDALGGTIDA